MTLAGARRLASHATAGFAFGAAAAGGELPAAVVAAFGAAFAASLALGERLARGRGWIPTAAAALAFFALAGAWLEGGMDLVVAATSFSAVLAANRLVARKGAADDGLLYLAALLMLAGGAALGADLSYGVCFAGFALSATSALTLSHLARSADEAKATRRQADALAGGRLMGGVLALSLLGLAGAIGVFFAFPRLTTGAWARHRGPARGATAGFTGELRLGGTGILKSDARVVVHVSVQPDPGVQRLDLRWKGRSLDRYDGREWSALAGGRRARGSWQTGAADGALASLEIEVLPGAQTSAVFQPQGAAAVSRPRRVPPGTWGASPPLELSLDDAGDLQVVPAPAGTYAYSARATLAPRGDLAGRGSEYPPRLAARLLQLPPLDPRLPALAERWTAGLSDPYQKALAIERELQRFQYSSELPGDAPDPLAQFLFERRAGHCELFSTAMAVLLRASGVPARVVVGFYGGERTGPGRYALRAGDAHAWTEVYFPGVGFAAFDPTPSEGRGAAPRAVSALWADALDALERAWRTSVVDYSLSDQVRGLRLLAGGLARLGARSGAGATAPLRAIGAAAVVVLSALLARGWWRRGAGSRGGPRRPSPPAAALYRALLRRLARRGLAKPAGQTPREFAARLAAESRVEAGEVRALTERYLAARFGGRPLGKNELRALRRRVRAL